MSANHNDLSNESWDNVEAPQPLPNGVRFRFQGLGATYRAPENDGEDHTYSFVYRPVGPVDEDFDTSALPGDWQGMKVFKRFRVPSWNSNFDVKAWFKANGVDVSGMNRTQSCDAFKARKPVIDATLKVRTYTDKNTGAVKFDMDLTKVQAAGGDGD